MIGSLRRNADLSTAGRLLALALACLSAGCAAITNPVADGIPVRRLPDELRGQSREALRPVPLDLLRQKPPTVYRLAPGDVLGIVVENVLGERNQPPPVRIADTGNQPPALGYPIVVQANGTIVLPYVEPIPVNGLSLVEAQEAIRRAYVEQKQILKAGTERIIVTLLQPRRYHVLVMRQDGGTGGVPAGPQIFPGYTGIIIGSSKKGTGYQLDLPAGENDVLNALARSGGLPGTDAKNEVVIYRKSAQGGASGGRIRIPLRLRPGEPVPFTPQDVILYDGDIVYLESRDAEVFYTSGLLGSGQYPLPRDYDLDVVQAVALVRGPLVNGGFSQNAFVPQAVNSGLGLDSPSLLTVLRRAGCDRQIPIRVDLNLALRDPRERILVQPGDILVMQERPGEAIGRYLSQQFKINLFGFFIRQRDLTGTAQLLVP